MGVKTPSWAYYDNPCSKYGAVYIDLLKSPKFQALSNPAKVLYFTLCAHSHDEKALECLYMTIRELDSTLGLNTPEVDIRRVIYQSDYKYFVFPQKQYLAYGLDRKTVWKAKTELVKAGFIEEPVKQKKRMRVNIYAFSANWKNKNWTFNDKKNGDHCITFWHG